MREASYYSFSLMAQELLHLPPHFLVARSSYILCGSKPDPSDDSPRAPARVGLNMY